MQSHRESVRQADRDHGLVGFAADRWRRLHDRRHLRRRRLEHGRRTLPDRRRRVREDVQVKSLRRKAHEQGARPHGYGSFFHTTTSHRSHRVSSYHRTWRGSASSRRKDGEMNKPKKSQSDIMKMFIL